MKWLQKAFIEAKTLINEPPHDKTNKVIVRPVKTRISLGIRPVWSESSLCTQWVAKDHSFLHADSKDSDQTGRMPRLIWVFAGCTCHFVGFVIRRLKCYVLITNQYYCWHIIFWHNFTVIWNLLLYRYRVKTRQNVRFLHALIYILTLFCDRTNRT